MAKKLSDAMLAALRNLAAGRSIEHGMCGRSQSGGLVGTIYALRRRDLIDTHNRITEAGREAARTGRHG